MDWREHITVPLQTGNKWCLVRTAGSSLLSPVCTDKKGQGLSSGSFSLSPQHLFKSCDASHSIYEHLINIHFFWGQQLQLPASKQTLISLADLRKFRSYKGGSVRDLLRAMRNKVKFLHMQTQQANRLLVHENTPCTGRLGDSTWAFPCYFVSYRSTITENCLLRCRRPWAPSQMILYITSQLVSLTCSYIPTMQCISAATKDCFSTTMIRTLQRRALQEMLFESRASFLLWNQHSKHKAVKQAYLLQGKAGSKSWIVSLRKPSFQVPCTVPALDQEIVGDQGAMKLQKQWTLVLELSQGRSQDKRRGRAKAGYKHHPLSLYCTWCCNLCFTAKNQNTVTETIELVGGGTRKRNLLVAANQSLPLHYCHTALGTLQWGERELFLVRQSL